MNNIQFALDEARDNKFGVYAQIAGQQHDAGFDAYMTGTAFASLSKYVEVGNILNAKEEPNKQIEELKALVLKP